MVSQNATESLPGSKLMSSAADNGGVPVFCIVLPMYNEVDSARKCIDGIAGFLRSEGLSGSIIAVNDGSVDGTSELLCRLQTEYPELQVETHRVNGGYGSAVRTGFQAAIRDGCDYALVMDADGTQRPDFIRGFFEPMRAGIDFIKATRYAKNGRVVGVPWSRRVISWVGNKLAQVALRTPLTDYTNGFRAISTKLLPGLVTTERGFPVLLEEVYLARKLGATFAEVPYTLEVRQDSESESKFVYSFDVYAAYLKYIFKR